jgi:hypothetical protein
MLRWAGLCTILAGCALFAAWASADDAIPVPGSSPDLATLQKRLDDLEKQIGCGQGCCETVCCDPCHCPGVVVGLEVAFLRLHEDQGNADPYNDLEAAPRIWAGYEGANGLGVRARWFNYWDTSSAANILRAHLYTVDIEATDAFQLGSKWSGLITGGVRYAEDNQLFFPGTRFVTCGTGPVLGMELTRPIGEHFALFALGRESILFGDTVEGPAATALRARNTLFDVTEIQLGAQYQRTFNGSTYGFVRLAFEGQYWCGGSGDPFGVSANVGLIGGVAAIGLCR